MTTSNGSHGALSHDRLQDLAKRHLMMHFTRHSTFRNEDVPVISHGEGCWLYDTKGKKYFDGLAGLFCTQIGYSHGAELGEAAAKQMAELPFYTNWSYAHPRAIELAAKVSELAPGDLGRADRQRLAHGPDRAEPVSPAAAALEVLLIDRDREDALRAAGVAAAVGLKGVEERAGLLQTALRVDHHLAYHPALAAFDLGLALDHRKLLLDVPHRLQSTRGLGWG